MRPPDDIKRELAQQWLAKADEDFDLVTHLIAEKTSYRTAIGFHAQQAIEKYLKAFLVHVQCEFPKTHDLGQLLDLVMTADQPLAESLRDITFLNPYIDTTVVLVGSDVRPASVRSP